MNWCLPTVVLEKTLESPLDCKEIKPVNPKGDQSWIFIGRTDVEAPILWPPDVKSWLIGKVSDFGKDWGYEKGVGDRRWDGWMALPTEWTWVWANTGRQCLHYQGSLACCSPWGHKESGPTERLNNDDSTIWSEAGWIPDTGPQIWRAEYKVKANFQLLGGLVPLTSALFESQPGIIIVINLKAIITIINVTGMPWRVLRRWSWTPRGAHCGLLPQRLSVARIVPTKSPTEKWATFLLLHRGSFSFFCFLQPSFSFFFFCPQKHSDAWGKAPPSAL